MIARLLILFLFGWMAGCAIESSEVALPQGDVQAYTDSVHPVLEATCASLDCHGQANRPLRLYSEIGLRASVGLRDSPLSPEEAMANVNSLSGIDPATNPIDRHQALTKPLSVDAGGVAHVGRDLWPSVSDPAYLCLRAWLLGETTDPSFNAACSTAHDAVRLP